MAKLAHLVKKVEDSVAKTELNSQLAFNRTPSEIKCIGRELKDNANNNEKLKEQQAGHQRKIDGFLANQLQVVVREVMRTIDEKVQKATRVIPGRHPTTMGLRAPMLNTYDLVGIIQLSCSRARWSKTHTTL